MKLRIFSDLHSEFHPFSPTKHNDDKDCICVLAGDIGTLDKQKSLISVLEACSNQFKRVFYVLGNHEFYGDVYPDAYDKINEIIQFNNFNVKLLQNDFEIINNVVFVGATLWTDLSNPIDRMVAYRAMNDYRVIGVKQGKRPDILFDKIQDDFEQSKKYIFDTTKYFKKQNKKVVVITHHGVSYQSIAGHWKGDALNCAYVSALENYIFDAEPNVMIHGHVHSSFDYMIGETRIVGNPRGYANEKTGYNEDFYIEI